MSPLAADIVGLAGSALILGAFAYANLARQLDKVIFNLANLLGAGLLLASLWVNFNLAAFILEAVWAIIAAGGLLIALWPREMEQPELPEEKPEGLSAFDLNSHLNRDELLAIIGSLEPNYQEMFKILRHPQEVDNDLYERSTVGLFRLLRTQVATLENENLQRLSMVKFDIVNILAGRV